MHELAYMSIFAAVVLIIGIMEKRRIDGRVEKIPLRILVNGIRGKSTVTRLITGILKEDERRVVGKTTGTSARIIYWDRDEEEPIVRALQGPNISEQKHFNRKAVKRSADAIVSECMAVNPEYQAVFQERFVKANITVIANILEDHMEVMGPSLDHIAEAFSSTIPENGHLVMPDTPYRRYFHKLAEQKNTKLVICDEDAVDEEYLKKFPFMVFPQNAALALAVADILEIDREVALQGMLNAPVDPGAMRVHQIGEPADQKFFFNGFAANDATSTLNIWERIKQLGYPVHNATIVMNCRDDRVERTIQFAEDVIPHIEMKNLIVMGKDVWPVKNAYEEGKYKADNFINLEGYDTEEVVQQLKDLPRETVIYGIGNIHGGGDKLADEMALLAETHMTDEEELTSIREADSNKGYRTSYQGN